MKLDYFTIQRHKVKTKSLYLKPKFSYELTCELKGIKCSFCGKRGHYGECVRE